ncbi:MAG: hypothetical protein Q9160_008820 [Pyrenula sp. 1 TL-2023]
MVSTRSKTAPKQNTLQNPTRKPAKTSRDAVTKTTKACNTSKSSKPAKAKTPSTRQPLAEKSSNKAALTTGETVIEKRENPIEKTQKKGSKATAPTKKLNELVRIDGGGAAHPDDNFVLDAFLMNVGDPVIERRISCPADSTMEDLHYALNIAFGWAQCHMWQFEFMSDNAINLTMLDAFKAKAKTLSIAPHIMHGFDDEDHRLMRREADEVSMSEMLTDRKWLGNEESGRFIYQYDMGSSWEHAVEIVGRAPKQARFECLSGNGHSCAEDSNPPEWQAIKDAYRKPKNKRNSEDEDMIEWYEEGGCANGDSKGLGGKKGAERWSRTAVNKELRAALKKVMVIVPVRR